MKLSMMVIAGLGGKADSERHAVNTGKAVTAIQPNMLSVLTLRLYKGTEMLRQFEAGEFELLSPAGLAREVHAMLENVEIRPETTPCSGATTSPTTCLWQAPCPRTGTGCSGNWMFPWKSFQN